MDTAADDRYPSGELEKTVEVLRVYVHRLYQHWRFFEEFACQTPDFCDLVNRRTGCVFAVFQEALIDSIKLGLSRLSDPAVAKKGKLGIDVENLSFQNAYKKAKCDDEGKVAAFQAQVMKVKIERNKRIAHLDFATAIGAEKITSSTVAEIRAAVESAINICDHLLLKVSSTGYAWDLVSEEASSQIDVLSRILIAGNEKLDVSY